MFEETEETNDIETPDIDFPSLKKGIITIDIDDAQQWLAEGLISKTFYTYLVLRLRFDGESKNIDVSALANILSCAIPVENKIKTIDFTGEDAFSEVAKLNKKRVLNIKQTAIQLSLNI